MAKAVEVGGQWVQTTCSTADLSVLLGVSPRVVRDLASRSVLVAAEQPGMYQTLPSLHAYLEDLRNKAAGRSEDSRLAGVRARGAEADAEIAELKLAQMKGEVLTLDEVGEEWSRLARLYKGTVMQIPSRLRSTIPHLTAHDQETVREICADVLTTLSEEIDVGVIGADSAELQPDGD